MYKLLFVFLILIGSFDYRISGLNYWDEALLFVVPAYYLLTSKKIFLKKEQINILASIILLTAIGLISNLIHPEFQPSLVAIAKDIIAFIKFPVLASLLINIKKTKDQKSITHDAALMSKILLYVMLGTAIVGYVVDIGVYSDEVRFVKCFRFYFSHPTFLVSSIIMMISVLLVDGIKRNKKELLIAGFLIFLTGRTKGYIMIVVLLIVLIIRPSFLSKAFKSISGKLKIKKQYLITGIICVGVIGFALGIAKVMQYVGWGLTAARPALYVVGLYLLRDCFPFGSGFGTFASSISGEYYSNVYELYNISNVNGLVRGHTNYIADTFPPYIYGQFGLIGAIAYVFLVVQLIKYQLKRIKSYDKVIGFLFAWLYVLVACTSETFLTNSSGVQMAVILTVFIGTDCNLKADNNKISVG